MNLYNCLTFPVFLVLNAICTTYRYTSALDNILDFPPPVYWNNNRFKFDATCSQILAIFSDDDPLFLVIILLLLCYLPSSELLSKGNKHNISGLAFHWRRFSLFFFSRQHDLEPLYDCVTLEEPFNWIAL